MDAVTECDPTGDQFPLVSTIPISADTVAGSSCAGCGRSSSVPAEVTSGRTLSVSTRRVP
eukprot:3265806-Rhodomonas_salina.2